MSKPFTHTSSKRTEPVSKVLELEERYRTRYVAWAGILLLWLATIVSIILRGAAPEWLLFTALSLVIISSGLFPWLASYGLSYERKISASTVDQGQMQVAITLARALPIPAVWYSVNDQLLNSSTMRGEKLKLRAGFTPLFHKRMSLTYCIKHMERGSYVAKPTMISVGDWLGLTCITLQRQQAASFIVLPQYEEPEEESYVARNTSSIWMKQRSAATGEQLTRNNKSIWSRQGQAHGELLEGHERLNEGLGLATRPYAAGDSYRRLDSRAAARGMGLHTKLEQSEDNAPKLCMLLDQYDLPYEEAQQDQLFHSLVAWCLADIVKAAKEQNISVLSDDWSFEYDGEQHSDELKYLLALTRPDVALNMKERTVFFSPLLPTNGHIVVYSGAWKDSEGWLALAEAAWLKGSTLELQFVTTNRVMTYAMREQQKVLEAAGVQIVWRYSYMKPSSMIEIEQGSERYATTGA